MRKIGKNSRPDFINRKLIRLKSNRSAAVELSFTTIVILVLAMTMLILGLVLVKSIFSGATASVNDLNDKVKAKIQSMFTDEETTGVIIMLGSDQTAKIKQDTQGFGLAIGARTEAGDKIEKRDRLKYTLSLDEDKTNNCVKILGKSVVQNMFSQKMGTEYAFDQYNGDKAFAIITLSVPKGTSTCTQTVYVDVRDTQTNSAVGGNYFVVQIIKSGFLFF